MDDLEARLIALQRTDEGYRVELDDLARRVAALETAAPARSPLRSRKLLVAVAAMIAPVIGPRLGLSTEQVMAVVLPAIAYVAGEAYVDAKAAAAPPQNTKE